MGRWIAQIVILVVGVYFGTQTKSINQVTVWNVSALYGGYTAPNILKWHWYRFNGFGYFWGMIGGLLGAAPFIIPQVSAWLMPGIAPDLRPFWGFPFILVFSLVACVVGSLVTKPESDEDLMRFYRQTRPWGFWKSIHAKVLAQDPGFKLDAHPTRDAINIAVGIVWQLTFVMIPLYMVLRNWRGMWLTILVLLVTSALLKRNWLDKLGREETRASDARSS